MKKLIELDAALDAFKKELTEGKKRKYVTSCSAIGYEGAKQILEGLPSAQPTMYGYDIKTLAFVAGVMAQEGVTPEEAVATFRDIQKCVNYIWSDVHKTIQKSMDDVMNHDCSTCLHSDRMPHIYPCDKCSTGHERWESKT